MVENKPGDEIRSGIAYLETIELADTFGSYADIYKAMAYMGLSRLHQKKGLEKRGSSYARKASNLLPTTLFLNE